MQYRWLGAPMALIVAAGATLGSTAHAMRQAALPAGSVLKVRLDDTLSSDRSQTGDRFTATVTNGDTGYGLPSGTRVSGVVTEVRPSSSDRPGMLDVDFRTLLLPTGETYRIAGVPTSLDSKSVQRTSDGRLVARSTKSKDKTKFIAYGAGAGFVIGSLLGSNVKGGLLGAAAGYLYGNSQKNKGNGRDVVLKPGSEFGVRLDQRVALVSTRGTGYRRLNNPAIARHPVTDLATNTNRNSAPARYAGREEVFPTGSVLKVRLDEEIGSDRSHQGDRFLATVTSEGSGYDLPSGAKVEGVVTEVHQAKSDKPGMLDVDFRTLRMPNGRTYPIVGVATSLDSKNVERSSDGRLVARATKSKDRTKFIAYGAGAGFVIGSLLGSNVKGGLLGAAAGYLYGQSQKNKGNGHEVVLKQGSEFGVRLDQRLAFAAP